MCVVETYCQYQCFLQYMVVKLWLVDLPSATSCGILLHFISGVYTFCTITNGGVMIDTGLVIHDPVTYKTMFVNSIVHWLVFFMLNCENTFCPPCWHVPPPQHSNLFFCSSSFAESPLKRQDYHCFIVSRKENIWDTF